MKRVFFGMFFAMSLVGFAGCTHYVDSDNEDIVKQCLDDPSLPICQDDPGDDDGSEDNPSLDDDL